MGRRLVFGAIVTVLAVGAAAGGLWWQGARAAAQVRATVLSAAEVELARDPIDRGALVDVDRELARVAAKDPSPTLLHARARIALLLRLPEEAMSFLDEVMLRGQAGIPDLELRARAMALRHAVGGRIADALDAAARAIEHFDATGSPASGMLAWQCASRVGDSAQRDAIGERMAARCPDAWETKVVQTLREFDDKFDEKEPATGDAVRRLAVDVPPVPEMDIALALLDLVDADESVRGRGVETIRRVLAQVPASKPARIVAVLAHDRVGDVAGRNAHLQWLIQNFPQDERVEGWREMALRQ